VADTAGASKPSAAAGNNGNGKKKGGSSVSVSSQLTAVGDTQGVYKTGVYVVMMKGDPAVMVEAEGRSGKYNPNSAAAQKHARDLEAKHNRALNKVGAGGKKIYSYVHSFNGFTAELSGNQAVALAKDPDVAQIWADEFRQLETNYSPEFLGLMDENGAWNMGVDGEGVILGIIDSGGWSGDHPSFSDAGDSDYNSYGPPPAHFNGRCQSGENWSQQDCNNKLIGARYFVGGWGASPNGKARNGVVPQGFNSARDDDGVGHGSHTASTAGGNRGVNMTIGGSDVLGDSTGSGVAPRARIIHYKACWNDEGCTTSDLVAAIDHAVADGADVINYSIGSSSTNIFAPDDVAFLFANFAGVYVATSNGNSGPGAGTVGSPAGDPWLLSVGASTRDGVQTTLALRVNSPESVADDWSALEGAITRSLFLTGDVSGDLKAADPLLACEPLTNDLTGYVAFIERGTCAFTTKVENAVDAGAKAVVLFTDSRPKTAMGGAATAKTKSVPGEMIDRGPGLALLAELEAGSTVNVTLSPSIFLPADDTGNIMADFSSRGPNLGAIDIIKPDVTAPGVSILAATTPNPLPDGKKEDTGELYRYVSGTSMSSPHAAGALALIKQAHPDWSPSAAKSALMTTARQNVLKEDGATDADPFDFGNGYIVPSAALDPGLVYDAGVGDYVGYICAVNPNFWFPGTCEFFAGLGYDTEDPTQLNYPSVGISQMVGTKTVKRTVTNVGDSEATYTASVENPPGVTVEISPAEMTLAPGESATFDVILSVTPDVETGGFLFGSYTLSDGDHNVYSSIAVRPLGIAAPAQVDGTGADGQVTFDVGFGFEGDYTAGVHGLNPATEIEDTVADDPNNSYDFPGGPGITRVFWGYGPDTAYARIELRDELTDGNDDLDLYVWECDAVTFGCSQIGASTSGTSAEKVDILLPKEFTDFGVPGSVIYVIDVHGWQTEGPDANYTMLLWDFGLVDDAGNMTVDPTNVAATLGAAQTLTVDWTGLDEAQKYLGAISHSSPGGLEGLTLISVE
jgi:hypothetical protein